MKVTNKSWLSSYRNPDAFDQKKIDQKKKETLMPSSCPQIARFKCSLHVIMIIFKVQIIL